MATSQVLQKAAILSVTGSTLRVAHPDVSAYPLTYMNTPTAAAATTFSFYDNKGFEDNDWLTLGDPGDEQSEEVDVNGAVTRGQAITLTNSTKFAHEIDTPVRKILERGFTIYGAATDGGAGTIIESVDAIISPIANAVMINWTAGFTEYTLISTDTSYAFYYVEFTDGVTTGTKSDYIAAAGAGRTSLSKIFAVALRKANAKLGAPITTDFLVEAANDCLDEIVQFTYKDEFNNDSKPDWAFEIQDDITNLALVEGENTYALSSLDPDVKFPETDQSIIEVQLGAAPALHKISIQNMTNYLSDRAKTTVGTTFVAAATTATLTDSNDFTSSGSLQIVGQSEAITYTSKDDSTGIISGIPASGSGSISSTTALAGTSVWQGLTPGEPRAYAVYEGNIILDRQADSTWAGRKIKVKYFGKQGPFTDASDTTDVTFINAFHEYVAFAIWELKQNEKKADRFYQKFIKIVRDNAIRNESPVLDIQKYYIYTDPYNTLPTRRDGQRTLLQRNW